MSKAPKIYAVEDIMVGGKAVARGKEIKTDAETAATLMRLGRATEDEPEEPKGDAEPEQKVGDGKTAA